jgi:hypothetical protein
MQNTVVLRTTDLEESLAGLAITGALAPVLLQASWRALENIRAISTKLPAYSSASNPRLMCRNPLPDFCLPDFCQTLEV